MSEQHKQMNDLELLLATLPPHIQQAIVNSRLAPDDLLEIIMDLGRKPEARYRDCELLLSEQEVTHQDINYVVERVGTFGEDNRAGIPRTLHRISAIRNRNAAIIGLTCRVGRAIFGTVTIIRDIIESGKSILLLGKPGTGKTTLLRETARVLSEDLRKRVVVVDTSNEIAGDGDIPHAGIGRARRMQVIRPSAQHAVMIEAVENHMPEVIVIDEIGTELEALAARTIAERGVQLIGTAHGNTLENLLMNPTLSDLIGGIQAVTLGDEEARRRGTQKTVLERKAPPTFEVLVEIQGWNQVAIYHDVASAVDELLRGGVLSPVLRRRRDDGQVEIIPSPPLPSRVEQRVNFFRRPWRKGDHQDDHLRAHEREQDIREHYNGKSSAIALPATNGVETSTVGTQRIFPFGVNRHRLEDAIQHLHVPAVIVRSLEEATLVMTVKNYYRRSPQSLQRAAAQGVPVYVLRSNTVSQMERQLESIFQLTPDDPNDPSDPHRDRYDDASLRAALRETELAIAQVISGERDVVEMAPQNSYIRRLQHEMAGRYNLRSKSRGSEPHRRVRIYGP